MSIDERTRREIRLKRKRIKTLVKSLAMSLLFAAGAVFHIAGASSEAGAARFFGGAPKPYVKLEDGEAVVSFIDVGQGDCELIRVGDVNILIDSGDVESENDVIGFLEYNGVTHLDIVIATHQHTDHYGAMYKVLDSFDVALLLMPELPEELIPYGITFERLLTVASDNNIPVRYAKAGERFILGEGCYLDILSPIYYDYSDLNDFSITAKFVHGENTFLFTGDLQEFSELDLVESSADLDADVLKLGHHGSAGASCEEFLKAVTPSIAVVGAAEYNSYRHPRVEVLERLKSVGCYTSYSTANNGNVVIVSDGAGLRVEVEKNYALELD